jgi:hypothetical protein
MARTKEHADWMSQALTITLSDLRCRIGLQVTQEMSQISGDSRSNNIIRKVCSRSADELGDIVFELVFN